LGNPTDPEAVTLTALSASKVLRGVVTPTPTPTPAPPQTPPYGFYFARAAILVGLIAYVATVIALVAFTAELDSAAVTGSLGALFTLIGTVSGAYFGVKRSSDTEDKAREDEKATNEREQEAQKAVRDAGGAGFREMGGSQEERYIVVEPFLRFP
jgi:hypothetical protein